MDTETGPNVRRRQLGRQLRDLRIQAGLHSQEAAAQRAGLSRATISRIESAKQAILPKTVRLLCQAYGVGAPLIDHLTKAAAESDDRGWLVSYADTVPNWFERFAAEEAEATEIWTYEAELVPGLFQNAPYCRSVTAASAEHVTEDDLARAVEFRQARQERIEGKNPPRLVAVVNEAAIRRAVGGPEVMRDQLHHLAKLSELPNVELRVLPFSAGAHPAMTGSFTMLRFPDDDGMTTIFVEVEGGGLYPDHPDSVDRYAWIFRRLRELALPPDETTSLLSRVAGES